MESIIRIISTARLFSSSSDAIIIMISLLRWWSAFCDFILCLKHAFCIATFHVHMRVRWKWHSLWFHSSASKIAWKILFRQWQKETFLLPWQFWMRWSQSINGELHVCVRAGVCVYGVYSAWACRNALWLWLI